MCTRARIQEAQGYIAHQCVTDQRKLLAACLALAGRRRDFNLAI
jgi:hypothetical protein